MGFGKIAPLPKISLLMLIGGEIYALLCPSDSKQMWELNSFLMQTLSFVPTHLHRCWPR